MSNLDLAGKKFLVVGGAGFIGSHVVDQLLTEDVGEVIIYDNFHRGRADNIESALLDPRCKVFEHGGDIFHADILNKAMRGVDGVFHLAALRLMHCHEYPESAFEVNVRGTFNVIQAAVKNHVQKVVYSSSASVYGNALEFPMTEEHEFNNETFYGATKIAGEHMFKSLGSRYQLPWVGLRYMNTYGPRQDYQGAYISVMHRILDNLENGQQPIINGDGSQQYDFVAVEDVARANLCAIKSNASGKNYNVCSGVGTSLQELAELIIRRFGVETEIKYEATGLVFVTNRIGCPKRAATELGFTASIDLEEGIRRLFQWRNENKTLVEARRFQTVP